MLGVVQPAQCQHCAIGHKLPGQVVTACVPCDSGTFASLKGKTNKNNNNQQTTQTKNNKQLDVEQ